MPELPLLFLPFPHLADRTKKTFHPGGIHKPDVTRQGQRLSPIFSELQAAFEARRVEVQQNVAGIIDPEQVLVIETVGSVDEFANAVKRIQGLEWMGEVESEEIAPDQDFYDESNPEKILNGRLYLVMTNQRALGEMLSMWQRYQANPNMSFAYGQTKFRDVFQHLKNIHRWDVHDRLSETGVLDFWQEALEFGDNQVIPFEIELWFRESNEQRIASANQVTNLVRQAGGQILSQTVIENIAYHGLLAELPTTAIRGIVDCPATELVKCDNVMFFSPVGQMVVGDNNREGDVEIVHFEESPMPAGEPVVALLDGFPLANHHLLAGRLIIDDPDNWESDYTASSRVHGSSMASLIVHGDLNQPQPTLPRPVYVRPIMKPVESFTSSQEERIPETCLAVDLIHRAVKRLFEGDQGQDAVAPQIKIINLSIGDPVRQFTQSMSPLARLLDWLSVKYKVLFIVSAGNHTTEVTLDISPDEFNSFQANDLEASVIKALYRDAKHRRLLSPAETINGISVGAAHFDEAQVVRHGNRFDPFVHPLPSPISAFGSGYRRAIKPDIIFNGGRQWYRLPALPTTPVTIKPAIFRSPPGNKIAVPGESVGQLNSIAYSCGTSNATALISRAASICYDSLLHLFRNQADETDLATFEIPLLKAMLVHGCSWGEIGSRISEILRTPDNGRQLNSLVSRWIGYGYPEIDRVLHCTEQRATLLGFGQLSNDEGHIFRLPLPPSLASRSEKRRLTVTLAWLSPILARTQKYRAAYLWFELGNNELASTRSDVGYNPSRRGTVQHEVFEGQSAAPYVDGDVIEIKVNCCEDAGKILQPIAYGLAVSLEVAEGIDIAVYNEIRNRIAPAIQIQQTIGQDRE